MAFSMPTGNKNSRRKAVLISEINVTPLVDVMLVLLIIFMVTSPLMVAGIEVELPKTDSTQIVGQDEPISISIDKAGNWFVNDNKINKEDLVKRLKAVTKEKYDTKIYLRGDAKVDYGEVARVLGTITNAGFIKVSVITSLKEN